MKKLLSILCTGLLLCGAGLTSCENYDDPVTGNAYGNNSIPEGRTISIAALKEKYNDFIDTSKDTYTTIEGETRIEGVVIGDDESGNIYKQLVIGDETGAIIVGVNTTGLYAFCPVGQKVVIDCKGLQIGSYRKLAQIGTIYDGKVGRMPEYVWKQRVRLINEPKLFYDELKPLIEYATQKSGEINNALNDAQSLCDQKMYYEASQSLDKIATDYKLPPTEQKKFDEEKTTAENGIKSVKITDALKNVETIYNGGDYDKATEELSKIDTSNLTDAQSQKYQSLQTNIANAKAAAEKAAAEAKAKAKIDISMARSKVIGTSGYPYASLLAENDEKWYFAPTDEPDANVRDSGGHVSKGVMVYSVDKNTGNINREQ